MNDELLKLRKQIDATDEELLNILAKRIQIVDKIGKLKKNNGIKPLDKQRWKKVLDSKLLKAKSLNLPEQFIKKIYSLIHKQSLEIENNIK